MQHLIRYGISLVLAAALLGHAAGIAPLPFIERLDGIFYDARLRLTAPGQADDRVVIVDIDERSLAEVGRWPWHRKHVADLVTRMFDRYGARLVAMDMVFAEPDEHVELHALEELARTTLKDDAAYRQAFAAMRSRLDYDRLFADTLRGRPVVLGYFLSNIAGAGSGALPQPVLQQGALTGGDAVVTQWSNFGGNLSQLQQAAAASGHLNPMVDVDGVLRRVPLLAEYRGGYYESLALAVVRQLRDQPPVVPGFPNEGATIEWLDLPSAAGSFRIPVDVNVAALVPYPGPERSFKYVSAVDVLKGRLPAESLRGRILLVGTTAAGLKDLRVTPVGSAYPGVEVQASLIAGMLDGSLKQQPAYLVGADVLQLVLGTLLMMFLVPRLPPLRATLATLAALAILAWINMTLWSAGLVLPCAAALILVTALYTLDMSWGYFVESRDKRLMTKLFGQYVQPELVREMARNPASYSLAGRNAELTVMFADIQAFTKMAESLGPSDVTRLMNEYLNAMTAVIQHQRGTLDKYIGDAIMAFWGAPLPDDKHAEHGIRAALQMQKDIRKLDAPFKDKGWPALHIGVGLNCGKMSVGNMGSSFRRAYTVMGDAVNLGARLEGLTKEYGVGILVSENIVKAAPIAIYKELDKVRVKGKLEPVAIFEPVGLIGEIGESAIDEVERFHKALAKYRAQKWDEAENMLTALHQAAPQTKVYKVYLDRIADLRNQELGENWDGVFTFKTK